MAISFTPEQQKVIEQRDCNVLVSAAAGSGKTAVLVERIVRMVCDEQKPVDIDRLLVVTFTNAAAAEMRERIAKGIQDKLLEQPESEHIQKQATLLHHAQITTIDSFCLFLLRNHFNEIGLDPAFRIADEGEIKLMQQDVMKELIEDSYGTGEEAFRYCVEYFCPGGKESRLEQYILNLSAYAASFPWPEEWLESAGTVQELCEDACGSYLLKYLKGILGGCVQKLTRVQALCQEPDGPYMYGELIDKELEQLERCAGCEDLVSFEQRLAGVVFDRLSTKKDDTVSPLKRELAKNIRNQVKEQLQELSGTVFATPLELAAKQNAACGAPVCTLIDLVLEFDRRMSEKKREKKVVDFSDVEHFALNILLKRENGEIVPGAVAREYRKHFAEILIDEYQDSNLVQEFLLSAVSGEEDGVFNRFMVGDVKQSIYRFRLARPALFLEKYNTYGETGSCRRIDLAKNFRSRRQVVDTVNRVFERLMTEQTGGVPYDDRAALYLGADYPENPLPQANESELLLVEKPGSDEEGNARELEAAAVAAKIKSLCGKFPVRDKASGELRSAKYSDMVILLRATSGWDETFKKVLEAEGIPAYVTSKTGYFAATEVQELLQFLRVLDNPLQDISLFGTMKSLFGGFTEEEIALIRSTNKGCSLYEALKRYGVNECAALGQRVQQFLDMVARYREMTAYTPVRELLTKIVTDFGYLNYVTALPAGSKRRANMEMLFTKAADFEKTSYFGLFHFIRYMEQLEKYDVDYGEADVLDENADVVRIMSIHKSKGLEFPVVFVAGLNKRFNMQDTNQALIADMDLGLATDYVNPERRVRNKTLRRLALARKLQEDSLAEELRILYVAFTRAKEKLILTASCAKAAEKWELWQNMDSGFGYLDFMDAGSYLDFLWPVLKESGIRVTVTDSSELSSEQLEEQLDMADRRQRLREAELYRDDAALQQLRERLSTPYAYGNLQGLYTKTTVSELKIAAMAGKDEEAYHAFEEKEVVPYIPSFRRGGEKVNGTVRGNAYHRVMELLAFSQVMVPEETKRGERLDAFLRDLVKQKTLSQEYFEAVSRKKLLCFLETELAERMKKAEEAGRLHREQPFVMGVSAGMLGEAFPSEETVLIQGIIDVFFEEEDGLVLLDYKTDVVPDLEALWKRYETQLDYYSDALTKITGKPVKERILYSFHLGSY